MNTHLPKLEIRSVSVGVDGGVQRTTCGSNGRVPSLPWSHLPSHSSLPPLLVPVQHLCSASSALILLLPDPLLL